MNKQFTKSDLKDGMVVTTRDGIKVTFIEGGLYIKEDLSFEFTTVINYFEDDLRFDGSSDSDIIKVSYMGETLWERKEYVSFDVARKSGKRIRYCGENSLIEMKKFKSVSGVLVDLSGYCFEHINQFLDDVKWEIEE